LVSSEHGAHYRGRNSGTFKHHPLNIGTLKVVLYGHAYKTDVDVSWLTALNCGPQLILTFTIYFFNQLTPMMYTFECVSKIAVMYAYS
jgi:hypothetical protein